MCCVTAWFSIGVKSTCESFQNVLGLGGGQQWRQLRDAVQHGNLAILVALKTQFINAISEEKALDLPKFKTTPPN